MSDNIVFEKWLESYKPYATSQDRGLFSARDAWDAAWHYATEVSAEQTVSGYETMIQNLKNQLAECRKSRSVCEVCFTSSFAPCEPETPNAVPDPLSNGAWMVCQCCSLHAQLEQSNEKLDQEKKKAARLDELYEAWIQKRF